MGVVKQRLGCDFDQLHELANEHKTLRRFLGQADVWDEHRYNCQTLVDDVRLLSPELLVGVDHLIVERCHAIAGKMPGAHLRGRCDSFVAETDVHYPTDVSLLWDARRFLIRTTGRQEVGEDSDPLSFVPAVRVMRCRMIYPGAFPQRQRTGRSA